MATTTYYMSPITLLIQMFSNIGIPLQNGFVCVYQAGTTTLQTTYTDSTGTTANQNPIPLSPAGRLQTAGGAPTTVWLPQGMPHKMVIEDQNSNFVLGIDNLTSLNDPATLLSLLSTVSTSTVLGGADLVANAVRSYDVLASVRAAQAPSLATGQTLVIDVEGGILVNDGNGGIFYWSAVSTATDDGVNVIKPTASSNSTPGRYLRQVNLFGTTGIFVATGVGFSGTAPTMTCTYVQNGNQVTVSFPGLTGVSNSASFALSGWPIGLRGVVNTVYSPLISAEDNSAGGVSANMAIPNQTGGNVVVSINNVSGNWTASNTKGLFGGSVCYVAS